MRERSFGVTTLAFMSVMVALYAQMGAIPLLMGGSIFTTHGSLQGAAALVLGALFLGLAVASYAVGYGTWTRKHWSWAGAIVVFGMLIAVNVMLAILSSNLLAVPLSTVGAVAGLWLLSRPAVKAELLGRTLEAKASGTANDRLEVPEGAREVPEGAR